MPVFVSGEEVEEKTFRAWIEECVEVHVRRRPNLALNSLGKHKNFFCAPIALPARLNQTTGIRWYAPRHNANSVRRRDAACQWEEDPHSAVETKVKIDDSTKRVALDDSVAAVRDQLERAICDHPPSSRSKISGTRRRTISAEKGIDMPVAVLVGSSSESTISKTSECALTTRRFSLERHSTPLPNSAALKEDLSVDISHLYDRLESSSRGSTRAIPESAPRRQAPKEVPTATPALPGVAIDEKKGLSEAGNDRGPEPFIVPASVEQSAQQRRTCRDVPATAEIAREEDHQKKAGSDFANLIEPTELEPVESASLSTQKIVSSAPDEFTSLNQDGLVASERQQVVGCSPQTIDPDSIENKAQGEKVSQRRRSRSMEIVRMQSTVDAVSVGSQRRFSVDSALTFETNESQMVDSVPATFEEAGTYDPFRECSEDEATERSRTLSSPGDDKAASS